MVELTPEQQRLLASLSDEQIDTFQETAKKAVQVDNTAKDRDENITKIFNTAKRNEILSAVNVSSQHCWVCDQPIIEVVEEEVK